MSQSVIAIVDDLFFASKIRGTAEQIGVTVKFPRSLDALIETARADHPGVFICDLHSQRIEPVELAQTLKKDEELRSIRLIGFFSHVQTELMQRAEQAGFDRVLPRSAFVMHLGEILAGWET